MFFDEIGRCRPESANKLFPLIHEHRLQGAGLESLRYSIPDVVRRPIPRAVSLAAHTAAGQTMTVQPEDPLRLAESMQDPLRRALLAVTIPRLRRAWRGELLCLAALPAADAEILGWHATRPGHHRRDRAALIRQLEKLARL